MEINEKLALISSLESKYNEETIQAICEGVESVGTKSFSSVEDLMKDLHDENDN